MYLHLPPPLILQFFPRLAVSLTNPRPEIPVWGRAKGTQSQCFSSFLLLFSLLEQKKVCWMVFPGKICPFLGSDFVLVSALHFCTALVFAFLHDGTPGWSLVPPTLPPDSTSRPLLKWAEGEACQYHKYGLTYINFGPMLPFFCWFVRGYCTSSSCLELKTSTQSL